MEVVTRGVCSLSNRRGTLNGSKVGCVDLLSAFCGGRFSQNPINTSNPSLKLIEVFICVHKNKFL